MKVSAMTVVITEAISREVKMDAVEEMCQVQEELIVGKIPEVRDQFMKFYYSPKFSVDDVITYVLDRALTICKECLERVYFIFYQILSGNQEQINGCRGVGYGPDKSQNEDIEGDVDEFSLVEKDYDVLGITQAERDNVYKVSASIMRKTGKKTQRIQPQVLLTTSYIAEVTLSTFGVIQPFDVLGLTQVEKDNIYKITAALMNIPLKPKNGSIQSLRVA